MLQFISFDHAYVRADAVSHRSSQSGSDRCAQRDAFIDSKFCAHCDTCTDADGRASRAVNGAIAITIASAINADVYFSTNVCCDAVCIIWRQLLLVR